MKRLISFIRSTVILVIALLTYDYVKNLSSRYLFSHDHNSQNLSGSNACALLEKNTFCDVKESEDTSDIKTAVLFTSEELDHPISSVIETEKRCNLGAQDCASQACRNKKVESEEKQFRCAPHSHRHRKIFKSKDLSSEEKAKKISGVKVLCRARGYPPYGLSQANALWVANREKKESKNFHEFSKDSLLSSTEKLEKTGKDVGLLANDLNIEENPGPFVLPENKKSENFFVSEESYEEVPCGNPYPLPKQITLRHVEGWGDAIGYGTDYSTLAVLLASDYCQGHFMPMIDLRGHRFDNNSYAANVGIGARYIPCPKTSCEPCPKAFCEMLGFNIFYDYRGGLQGSFNQIGAGVEILGRRWDFRANGYVPFGRTTIKRTCVFKKYEHDDDESFSITRRECEFTSYGYNAEVGYYLIDGCVFSLYLAAGPYYLARKCYQETRGVLARTRLQFKDYVALDVSVSHDPVFETVWQAQLSVNIPLYQISSNKCRKPPCCFRERQIYQPIVRFEVMPLGRRDCWEKDFHQGSDDEDFDDGFDDDFDDDDE